MSYLTQMAGLAWHNFTSAAAGIGVALAVARGLTRRPGPDGAKTHRQLLGRSHPLHALRAAAAVASSSRCVLVSQGVIQNFSAYLEVTTLEGAKQMLALGPVASQEAIKELGTNGGGFFNANSAHPFENPTPLTNLLELRLHLRASRRALTYTYGRMARDQKQGWALFGAMAVLFFAGVATCYWAESHPNMAMHGLATSQSIGNMEGKEVRFGVANSALFATVTTDASCGAVNSMHDSFTPLGGLVPLVNIQLGEVIFGGVGAGLYGMLVFVVLTVFIAGLMVGRTPEYLGKKIEAQEMKLAMLYVLIFPLIILGFSAWCVGRRLRHVVAQQRRPARAVARSSTRTPAAPATTARRSPASTPTRPGGTSRLGIAMLAGRFLMIIPVLGIAGSMVNKKTVAAGPGTFPTNGLLFAALLVGVIVIVGALTFFPALSLGPIVEHFAALQREGVLMATHKQISLFDPSILRPAIVDSFRKLSPRGAGEEPGDVRGRGRQRC